MYPSFLNRPEVDGDVAGCRRGDLVVSLVDQFFIFVPAGFAQIVRNRIFDHCLLLLCIRVQYEVGKGKTAQYFPALGLKNTESCEVGHKASCTLLGLHFSEGHNEVKI
jgi:hypothetical protein